ncbi:hypothetical protein JN080_22690 [Bacillus sp. EB600]|nr:hypothetical protein [Bacillus sp. EB600]
MSFLEIPIWTAFSIAAVLGARKGRFKSDGSPNVFAPSSIPLASAGAFILWFGWFGFKAGSTLTAFDSNLSSIALNTALAAAAGGTSIKKTGEPINDPLHCFRHGLSLVVFRLNYGEPYHLKRRVRITDSHK